MKIFLSSTSHDLFDLRAYTVAVLQELGHEAIFHESPTFPALLNSHSHDQCLEAVKRVDLVLCLVDRRYGGKYAGQGNELHKDQVIQVNGKDANGTSCNSQVTVVASDLSITWMELITAYNSAIPVVTFARQRTLDEKQCRRSNQFTSNFRPAYVEKTEIFDMLDWITKQPANNWITPFHTIVDYDQKLRAWIRELDVTIIPPKDGGGNTSEEMAASANARRIAIIVEGEDDRVLVNELLELLKLPAHFVIIPSYGKSRMINAFESVVAPYGAVFDEVAILIDADTHAPSERADQIDGIRGVSTALQLDNIHPFAATPSIEAWIASGLRSEHDPRSFDKAKFMQTFGRKNAERLATFLKREFSLSLAEESNPELAAFVDWLRVQARSIL